MDSPLCIRCVHHIALPYEYATGDVHSPDQRARDKRKWRRIFNNNNNNNSKKKSIRVVEFHLVAAAKALHPRAINFIKLNPSPTMGYVKYPLSPVVGQRPVFFYHHARPCTYLVRWRSCFLLFYHFKEYYSTTEGSLRIRPRRIRECPWKILEFCRLGGRSLVVNGRIGETQDRETWWSEQSESRGCWELAWGVVLSIRTWRLEWNRNKAALYNFDTIPIDFLFFDWNKFEQLLHGLEQPVPRL